MRVASRAAGWQYSGSQSSLHSPQTTELPTSKTTHEIQILRPVTLSPPTDQSHHAQLVSSTTTEYQGQYLGCDLPGGNILLIGQEGIF